MGRNHLHALIATAIIGVFFQTAGLSQEQLRPYIATLSRSTFLVGEDGSETLVSTSVETAAMDSQGRTYRASHGGRNGQGPMTAFVVDPLSGSIYSIDYGRRIARVSAKHSPELAPPPGPELSRRQRAFNGIPCVKMDMLAKGTDGKVHVTGFACTAFQLGALKVQQDFRRTLDGKQYRFRCDLTEIRMDVEPNPQWFRVPDGFTIQNEDIARNPRIRP